MSMGSLPAHLSLALIPMTSIASTSHPSDPTPAADHLPSRSSKALLASTWQVLDQPPPPSLREILGAYRLRGDGDREMLMAMLNAKSAEDQRIASVASLHRSMLEYYQAYAGQMPETPHPSTSNLPGSSHQNGAYCPSSPHTAPTSHLPYDPASQRSTHAHPHKRVRTSESPPPSMSRSVPSTYTSSPPPGPPSPYSSRSDSVDQSPRPRDAMVIGSLLTTHTRQSRNDVSDSPCHKSSRQDRVQSRRR